MPKSPDLSRGLTTVWQVWRDGAWLPLGERPTEYCQPNDDLEAWMEVLDLPDGLYRSVTYTMAGADLGVSSPRKVEGAVALGSRVRRNIIDELARIGIGSLSQYEEGEREALRDALRANTSALVIAGATAPNRMKGDKRKGYVDANAAVCEMWRLLDTMHVPSVVPAMKMDSRNLHRAACSCNWFGAIGSQADAARAAAAHADAKNGAQ